jgi:hypothetical protein
MDVKEFIFRYFKGSEVVSLCLKETDYISVSQTFKFADHNTLKKFGGPQSLLILFRGP